MSLNLKYLRLETHETARNKACAIVSIPAGQCILSAEPLSTALLDEEKGRRCDACHVLGTKSRPLLKCSRCAAYWYCSTQCQSRQWKGHHKKICKPYNSFVSSADFRGLSTPERVDSILLSQLVAQVYPDGDFTFPPKIESPSLTLFLDLLPRLTANGRHALPVCTPGKVYPTSSAIEPFLSRFGNNNFLLHSHLTSFAHGIYPLASRVMNHSCYPNSVARYKIRQGESPVMEVVTLNKIHEGEEVTIPYVDPALPYDTRQVALQANYGFSCNCALCRFQHSAGAIMAAPTSVLELSRLEEQLYAYAQPLARASAPVPRDSVSPTLLDLPKSLYPLLHPDYLPALSEKFSKASHEGQYDVALSAGHTLLALYTVLYPPNFPQIGMHALESAKTAWNAVVTQSNEGTTSSNRLQTIEKEAGLFLGTARGVLENFGPEGDDGGPLEEVQVLEELLNGSPQV